MQATHSLTDEVTGYKTQFIKPFNRYLDMKLGEIGRSSEGALNYA